MIPLNIQPIEKMSNESTISIVDIWPTIQGEGPFAGQPAVFIRLAGCNLACPSCDTNYTLGRMQFSVEELVERVVKENPPSLFTKSLVVITGGEPFRQMILPLVAALNDKGFTVQIETNGTYGHPYLWTLQGKRFVIVCSPKTGSVHQDLQPHVHSLKYVVSAGRISEEDGLPLSVLGNGIPPARPWKNFTGTVYVQPCDDDDPVKNAANLKATVESCMKFGYTLCLQLHKIVGLP